MKFDKSCLRAQRSSSQSASSDRWILKKGGVLSIRQQLQRGPYPIDSLSRQDRKLTTHHLGHGQGRAGQASYAFLANAGSQGRG